MSTFEEIGELPEKYRKYKEQLKRLFLKYEIDGVKPLVNKYQNDESFKNEWIAFWSDIAKEDGGKLSLTTVGVIIGASLGGVGIAAMGGAIGLPLALVLGLGGFVGFVGGSKFDSLKKFGKDKRLSVKISNEIHNVLESKAQSMGLSLKDYVKLVLESDANIHLKNKPT